MKIASLARVVDVVAPHLPDVRGPRQLPEEVVEPLWVCEEKFGGRLGWNFVADKQSVGSENVRCFEPVWVAYSGKMIKPATSELVSRLTSEVSFEICWT